MNKNPIYFTNTQSLYYTEIPNNTNINKNKIICKQMTIPEVIKFIKKEKQELYVKKNTELGIIIVEPDEIDQLPELIGQPRPNNYLYFDYLENFLKTGDMK